MYPERAEVLRNEDIDNVIEPMVYEGEKPTTIRPPKGRGLDQKVYHDIKISDKSVDIKLSPKLPTQASLTERPLAPKPAMPSARLGKVD